ncbi:MULTISPECIES: serine O-acetyltransferase EpsC [Proteiniphilum]|jgi:serine O-acetyltransferase|uniref:serine O-acetyltransferase EpsC n=1 Tax=Proteiniphilum TaxID=294702 RepID=UPI001EECC2C0|nr:MULTISPECIES: serine O-acetyltransferase EpsC [Proteiniphilum]ULB34832.1 serine acetyltransferase [Proteiniphilum propionicum]
MTNNTLELIQQFNPPPISIPINKCELDKIIDSFITFMFPICDCPKSHNVHGGLIETAGLFHSNIAALTSEKKADDITEEFFSRFPTLQKRLFEDATCYLKFDPAAKTLEEVIIAYPGFYALCVHRIAHEIHHLGVPLIARIFSEYAHSKVGIDIHPAAKIGNNFFMDHGTGIVIGETTQIGNNVKIYQGVTLGALYVEKKLSDVKRHPTVEDNVVIYANATILGGETVIGHDSTIGGGAWLTQSVIPYSMVYNTVDVKIRTVKDFIHPNDFVI